MWVVSNRGWRKRWKAVITAPVEAANRVIGRWNDFLTSCVSLLQKNLEQYGVNAVDNLDKFKKKDIVIPEIPQGDDDEE